MHQIHVSNNYLLLFILTALVPVGNPHDSHAVVLVNEIAPHSIHDSSSDEFIELLNTGPEAVDLSGWELEGVGFVFPPTPLLSAGEYLVIAKDPANFSATYPSVTGVIGPYPGQLQNSGERIRLWDSAEQLVDEVEYQDSLPWPTAADGEGPSLELRHPELDNSLPENWAASDLTYNATAGWETLETDLNSASGDFFFYLSDHDGSGWIGDAESIHILIDDVRLEDLSAPGSNLLPDGGFESGNASDWKTVGTHHAGFASPEESCSGKYCYHYWALDSGNLLSRSVRYQPAVPVNLSAAKSYRFRARYKVIHGSARLTLGAGLTVGAGPFTVERRNTWGTPGGPNSVLRSPLTPILSSLLQVGPQWVVGVSQEIIATFHDVSRIASVELWHSIQPIGFSGLGVTPDEAVWEVAPMVADPSPAQTVFRSTIPGAPENSILRYHLRWTDTGGENHRYPHTGSYPRNLVAYVPGPVPDYGIPNLFLHLVPEYHQFYYSMLTAGELGSGVSGIFRFNRPTFPATLIDFEEGAIYEDVKWKPRGWDNLNNALFEGFRVGVSLEFRSGFLYRGEKREMDINNNLSRRNEAGVRTRLAHEVYRRAGVPVVRTRYVWLNQNGIEMGLMTELEAPDDVWLGRWGRDGAGSLYKARWSYHGPGFVPDQILRGNESLYASLEDYERCYLKKNRRSSNHSDLIAMIRGLNSPQLIGRVFQMVTNGSDVDGQRSFFESQVDVPNILNKYGVDSIITNHDRGQQNHYLYQDFSRDGRWETYPWDLDLTWESGTRALWNTLGQFPGGGAITVDPAFTPDWWFYQAEPFFTRLMAVPEYREAYVLGVRDHLRTTFSERQLFVQLDNYGIEGQAAFQRDKTIWPQVSGPPMSDLIAGSKDGVKRVRQAAFWRARNEDLDGFAIPPVLSDGRTDPPVPSPADPILFRVNALSAGTTNLSEGIATVTVHYRLNGGIVHSSPIHRASASSYDGDYLYSLSTQPDRTLVEYWFEAVDDLGLTDRLPASGSFFTESVADPSPSESLVTITEIMYHSDRLGNEWVEIENASTRYVDISGWWLGDNDPTHRFRLPADVVLAPGQRIVIAANEFVIREEYGIENVTGDFEFNFSNANDTVSIFNSTGGLIDSVTYSDVSPWPSGADGEGPSLELIDLASDNSMPGNWRASRAVRGTPGQPNGIEGSAPRVVINECSYDPADQGIVSDFNGDGTADESADEFVELYNTLLTPIDLSGWTLDDDNPGNGNTFVFPAGTVLPPLGYLVIFGGGSPTGFEVETFIGLPRLGNDGDQVRLHDGTQEVDSVGFEGSAEGTLNNLAIASDGGVLARVRDGLLDFEARPAGAATPGKTNNLGQEPTLVPGWIFY